MPQRRSQDHPKRPLDWLRRHRSQRSATDPVLQALLHGPEADARKLDAELGCWKIFAAGNGGDNGMIARWNSP
jgi:hypothetical protein